MGVFADVIPEGAQDAIRRKGARSKDAKSKRRLYIPNIRETEQTKTGDL